MNKVYEQKFLHNLYIVGIAVIIVFAIVALVSFIKALSFKEPPQAINQVHYADSAQFEQLKQQMRALKIKVDSLEKVCQSKPKVVYKYPKSKKDSCVIELYIHNKDKE